eukprot:Skav225801  [mRNA]  locus=scaffold5154:3516:4557:+ [translate_table: standard]
MGPCDKLLLIRADYAYTDEQRQLEEEAQQLRSGKLVDTEKLQQLAEKQQQRLARSHATQPVCAKGEATRYAAEICAAMLCYRTSQWRLG